MQPDLDKLARRCDRLADALTTTAWPPMTCMLIPSMLRSAEETVAELLAVTGEHQAWARAKAIEIVMLRRHFRVERRSKRRETQPGDVQ